MLGILSKENSVSGPSPEALVTSVHISVRMIEGAQKRLVICNSLLDLNFFSDNKISQTQTEKFQCKYMLHFNAKQSTVSE